MNNTTMYENNLVKILTSDGNIDPNLYIINSINGKLVNLICKETGIKVTINHQRIFKNLTKEDIEKSKIVKISNKNKNELENDIIDFEHLIQNNYEVWTKTGLNLGNDNPKISTIIVSAHCVIDPENTPNRGYEIFNSYNGTRGKKGKIGKKYLFKDKNAIEQKRKSLIKKGYELHKL